MVRCDYARLNISANEIRIQPADPRQTSPWRPRATPLYAITSVMGLTCEPFSRTGRDRGASLDPPWAGPWAMAVAPMHGLDSIVDFLVGKGVAADEAYEHAGESSESS